MPPRSAHPRTGHPLGESLRRLRERTGLREIVAETEVPVSRLVQPLFVGPRGGREEHRLLPAMVRRTPEDTAREARRLSGLGVPAVLLFGIPARKDPTGRSAWDPKGPVPRAIRAVRARAPEVAIIADVCLCEYTTHGHCGIVADGRVDNARTLPLLGRAAVVYAGAGADVVAPSAMMDHQVREIRRGLDAAGHERTAILAYAAKFASAFYGPFREAAGSAPEFGDRKSYQLDPRNGRAALRELRADASEGADLLMVKPALPYLDVLAAARREFALPLAAFQVSGEYAMIRAAAEHGWVDERRATWEALTAMRRAGADLVLTYFAGEFAAGAPRIGP